MLRGASRLHDRTQELERELRASAAAAGGAAFVLFCFGLLAARLVYLQVVQHDELSTQAENNRIAVVPIVPNRGLIVDRNGVVLANNYSAYTLEITPSKVGRPRGHDRRAGRAGRHPAARPQALQAADGGEQELRVAADPHQAHRRGGGALHRAALPLPRRRHQGAAVPQLPAGRGRQPPDRLHRPHQPGREGDDRRLAEDAAPTTAAPSTSASSASSRATRASCTASTGFEEVETSAGGRAVRRLTSTPADAGQHAGAVDRHPAAGAGRGAVRRPARRAGGDRPAQRRGAGLRQQAHLRPQPVRRRHRRRELARAQRVASTSRC